MRSFVCSCRSTQPIPPRSPPNQFPSRRPRSRPRPARHRARPDVVRQNTLLLHSVAFCPCRGELVTRCDASCEQSDLVYAVRRSEETNMNLCALTMRTNTNVRDDRPFSGPVKTYVAPFKGLKGGRNNSSVTYRSNFFQDDLDDPELAFDNNNTFRDECITHTHDKNKLGAKCLILHVRNYFR